MMPFTMPMRDIDLSLLRAFVLTADLSSMTLAARALNRSQGAVSQQIKRLEDLLNVDLFHRERNGLRLTRSAEWLLPKARELLRLNDYIWLEMTTDIVRGHVRLGVPQDLVSSLAAPILKTYSHSFPEVEISLVCGASPDLLEQLSINEIDIAIAEQPVTAITGESLKIEELVWVGAKQGRAYCQSPLPVSIVAESCAFRPVVLNALNGAGKHWRTMFESGNMEAMHATVGADLAVSVSLASAIPSHLEPLPQLADLPKLPSFAITLHVTKNPPTPAINELVMYIRNGIGE